MSGWIGSRMDGQGDETYSGVELHVARVVHALGVPARMGGQVDVSRSSPLDGCADSLVHHDLDAIKEEAPSGLEVVGRRQACALAGRWHGGRRVDGGEALLTQGGNIKRL